MKFGVWSIAIKAGKLDNRANLRDINGAEQELLEGINEMLDAVSDKVAWYESIIDAVPFPIHVTDDKMNWTIYE